MGGDFTLFLWAFFCWGVFLFVFIDITTTTVVISFLNTSFSLFFPILLSSSMMNCLKMGPVLGGHTAFTASFLCLFFFLGMGALGAGCMGYIQLDTLAPAFKAVRVSLGINYYYSLIFLIDHALFCQKE